MNPEYVDRLEEKGLKFVGQAAEQPNETGDSEMRMEICELRGMHFLGTLREPHNDCFYLLGHPYFVGVQFHPEYLSQPLKPSPPYLGLILAATGQLDAHLRCPRVPSALALVNGAMSSSSSTASFTTDGVDS